MTEQHYKLNVCEGSAWLEIEHHEGNRTTGRDIFDIATRGPLHVVADLLFWSAMEAETMNGECPPDMHEAARLLVLGIRVARGEHPRYWRIHGHAPWVSAADYGDE